MENHGFAKWQAIVLSFVAVVQTALLIAFKDIPVYMSVLFLFFTEASILYIRFAYAVALLHNRIQTLFARKNGASSYYDEPSDWIVYLHKMSGYVILFIFQIFMFF